MAEYKPLFVYLEPASIPQVVAHIQKYLSENPIISDEETIAELIREYIAAHPEIIAVASVNGKVGAVVLTGSDIMINPSSTVSVETQLLNLASMINNTGADITKIQANISQIYTTIGTLQTSVETNASNISALQTSVEGQGTRLAAAETDIDNLETTQNAQGTRINAAEGNISSLQTRMTQAETDIDTNKSSISSMNGILTLLSSDVQGLKNLDNWTTESNYCILPNGFKFCWGTTGVNANTQRPSGSTAALTAWYGGTTINFPITFDSTPFGVATAQEWASHWIGSITAVSKTGAQLRIGGDSNETKNVTWLVFGF